MVLITITLDPTKVSTSKIRYLCTALRKKVVEALLTETEHGLMPPLDEVDVDVKEFGALDVHHTDVRVMIEARLYNGREDDLRLRRKQIQEFLSTYFGTEATSCVWICLCVCSYGQNAQQK